MVSNQPSSCVPEITQKMWEIACSDLEGAEIRLKAAHGFGAPPETIARLERDIRIRKGICNGINFLITNRSDINTVISTKSSRKPN